MHTILQFIFDILTASWGLLMDASIYILFGIIVGGLLKMFLSTEYVVNHLGRGRFSSVLKAAMFGIPIPLCSCGVLPAAASLKRQGANNGATTAFLISTPESGVDSISITYALLDPIMTVARPLSAFISAVCAGFLENILNPPRPQLNMFQQTPCPVDDCCDGIDCSPDDHKKHHSFFEKIIAGLKYAVGDLWAELAGWFFIGLFLAGIISAVVPENMISSYLGGGLPSMLLMLTIGIPLYICATASTPVAAALILKGVSPGTALVFLLVGPATNLASLAVLTTLLGKRSTALYLTTIAIISVLCGLTVDVVYASLGISAIAVAGQAAEVMPLWLQYVSTATLVLISAKPLYHSLIYIFAKLTGRHQKSGCGCSQDHNTGINDRSGHSCGHHH